MPTQNRISDLPATLLAISVAALAAQAADEADSRLPGADLNLKLAAPITTWDEAVPLGNGTMGVLLWGEGNVIRLSLDRGDLWDERPSKRFTEVRERFNWAAMQRMVAANNMAEFNDVFDSNYDYDGPPTKLPAGRIEITLDPAQTAEEFGLNLATAEGLAKLKGGSEARLFVDAAAVDRPVAIMRIPGPPLKEVRLKSPDSVKKLGYAPPRTGEAEGLRWFEQDAVDGFAYAICVGWKRTGDATLLAVTVATRAEGKSPRAVAQARVDAALKAGYESLLAGHSGWWRSFWSQSRVTVPEPRILQHYYLVRYFYGAASRRGAPPMPLQGVWSADAGTLPPWKGDYHNDLNTQMTYMGYQGAGHFEEGACFLDMLWKLLPTFRKFARDFYDAPGAAVPGVMSLAGQPLGGWGQYSLSPTMGAWNAHLFYLHWRYTGDEEFLRTRAYPWCREIGECLLHLLKPDAKGILKLPLSSSPEIFDNSRRAFLIPNSNYDLMSMKMLFLSLAEMATACGDGKASSSWADAAKKLGDFHTTAEGLLLLDETTQLPGSHRHLSNLMGVYPFNLITADGGDRDRRIITASLKQWDDAGTKAWCGYSFSWMSALRARVGDADGAFHNLDIYTRAFTLRNGFHANGDQTGTGFSGMTYRPFTLEGNFLAVAAVHEMLLQSWSTHPGTGEPGTIRLFPATPSRWKTAAFQDLRAEGGYRVSARREEGVTTWFRIVAGSDGPMRVRDNFGGRQPRWNRDGVKRVGDDFELTMRRGKTLEATLLPTGRTAYDIEPLKEDTKFFTDGACSELRASVRSEDLVAFKSALLKAVATDMLNGKYDKAGRMASYEAYPSPRELARTLKLGEGFSRYENITGIYLEAGEHVVSVGNTGGKTLSLLIPDWMRQPPKGIDPTKDPDGWGLHRQEIELKEGFNVIQVKKSGNAYVSYFDDHAQEAPKVTIHFLTGKVNGFFDTSKHTNSDWDRLLDRAVSPILDARGKHIQVAYPVEWLKVYTRGKGVDLINNYDAMLNHHYTLMGLVKYKKVPRNRILARVNYNYYMFRDEDGVAYLGNKGTMRMVADPSVVISGDPCWGFSHEVGHVLQMTPQMTWGGMTEVSNNLFSMYTVCKMGNESRLKAQKNYASARKHIIEAKPKKSLLDGTDVFDRLVPFWQLHLYFSRNGRPDFYADVMEQMRLRPDAGTGDDAIRNQFEFVKLCCDVAELDLTDFFEKWGFFWVGTVTVDDYGKYRYNITPQMVDDAKSYIAKRKYPKPAADLTTIEE